MLLRGIRDRIGSVFGAVIAAVLFLICGALLAFVISPQQALEWRRIENLPELDAAAFAATATGEEVAVTGILDGNEALTDDGLIAYQHERWDVKPPDDEDDSPSGSWETIKKVVPALTIEIKGGTLTTTPVDSATLDGSLHETLVRGTGTQSASYQGQQLPEGSERTRGFKNGDLATVVGKKSSTGDLIPARIFGGDRVQMVESIRSGARTAFLIGIGMMICAPLVLVLGVVGGLLGRRRG
jgi:hypothetical protein